VRATKSNSDSSTIELEQLEMSIESPNIK
jgi:hypothetical protein